MRGPRNRRIPLTSFGVLRFLVLRAAIVTAGLVVAGCGANGTLDAGLSGALPTRAEVPVEMLGLDPAVATIEGLGPGSLGDYPAGYTEEWTESRDGRVGAREFRFEDPNYESYPASIVVPPRRR